MPFDLIALIAGLAAVLVLFGGIALLNFMKEQLRIRKLNESYEMLLRFSNKLDKMKIPTALLSIGVGGISIWVIIRVILSYA